MITVTKSLFGVTCWVSMPTNEKIRRVASGFSGETMVNSPLVLVETPVVVPLMRTVTPGRGSPFSSFTIPRIGFCWSGVVFAGLMMMVFPLNLYVNSF